MNKLTTLYKLIRFLCCIVLITGGLISCNVYKKLPNDQQLYAGAEVTMQPDSSLSKETVKVLQSQLETLPRPATNTFIFGYPLQVGLWYAFQTNRTKGIKHAIQKKVGQKPIFITQTIVNRNISIINNFLNKEGFFKPGVSGNIQPTKKEKVAKAIYNVVLPKRYQLDTINYEPDYSGELPGQLISDFKETQSKSILQTGQPYRFDNIQTEQLRIDRQLREAGYYYFRPDLVEIAADTTIGQQRANVFYSLDTNMPLSSRKQYLINDIFVFNSPNINEMQADSVDMDADYFRGVILADSSNAFKQSIFTDAIAFRPGNAYSIEKNDVTMQRLINLDNFQLVRNRFEVVNRLDSSLLNVYYYLSPKKKKTVRAEIGLLSRSNGFSGTQASLDWSNRNAFRGAEKLTISANGGIEFQVGGVQSTDQQLVNRNYRLALKAELTFPRFVMPFFSLNPEESRILPRTTITAGYETLIQSQFYNLNSISAGLNYVWRQGVVHEHTLSPISLTFVRASNISEKFIDLALNTDPLRLFRILDDQFILGGTYNYTFTPVIPPSEKYSYAFYGNIDAAGNLLSVFDKVRKNKENVGTLFKIPYSQYVRIDGDIRYYYDLTKNLKLANRAFAGFGIPYGNSKTLPFTRQYFSGGNNSIRAFRARNVGPGDFIRDKDNQYQQFIGSFTGDVKLEFNTELRQKINQYIGTALFIDAGNIWLYKDPLFYKDDNNPNPSVLFGKDFYKQLAVGAGVGLRIDVSFFVIRFDLATPIRKPSRLEGQRWVINEINLPNLKDPTWRRENLVLNIAVGYPF